MEEKEKTIINKIDISLLFLYDMLTGLDFKYYPKDVTEKLHDLIDYVGDLAFTKFPTGYDIEEQEYFVVTTLEK